MKRFLTAFLLSIAALCGGVCANAAAPTLASGAACLMDADTGEILYELNAGTELPMASITKVMTALVVLDNNGMEGETVATEQALATVDLDSTRVGFEVGEQLTNEELMYCMLVYSANDAANILAASVGGDVETFVQMMNDKAAELGCTHTHFVNPNGLDEDGHYTCARDMAKIAYAANQYEEFAKVSSTVSYQLPADNVIPEGWSVSTKVDMLRQDSEVYDARVYAAKTGWTTKAWNTFVACGRTEHANLIVTLLACPVKQGIFTDTKALLDYGEQAFTAVPIAVADYEAQAQQAAQQAGGTLTADMLTDLQLRLPTGMSAADVTYTYATDGADAYLDIGIAQKSQAAYGAATGTDGTQTILRVPLVRQQQSEQAVQGSGSAAATADDTMWRTARRLFFGLPQPVQGVMIVGGIVIFALILILLVLFFVGLIRRGANRRELKEQRKLEEQTKEQVAAEVSDAMEIANSAADSHITK